MGSTSNAMQPVWGSSQPSRCFGKAANGCSKHFPLSHYHAHTRAMPKGPQGQAEREELIAAREQIKRQIEILENPLRFYDRYPEGVAKLRATLAEIENCLAQMELDRA